MIGLVAFAHAQQGLTPEDDAPLIELQSRYNKGLVELEKKTAPIRKKLEQISGQWKAEEARLKAKYRMPEACILAPDRTWKCPAAPKPEEKK